MACTTPRPFRNDGSFGWPFDRPRAIMRSQRSRRPSACRPYPAYCARNSFGGAARQTPPGSAAARLAWRRRLRTPLHRAPPPTQESPQCTRIPPPHCHRRNRAGERGSADHSRRLVRPSPFARMGSVSHEVGPKGDNGTSGSPKAFHFCEGGALFACGATGEDAVGFGVIAGEVFGGRVTLPPVSVSPCSAASAGGAVSGVSTATCFAPASFSSGTTFGK